MSDQLQDYLREMYSKEQEALRLHEEDYRIEKENVEKIYKSIINNTFIETYYDITGDVSLCWSGKRYDVYFVKAFKQYCNELWREYPHNWNDYVKDIILITEDEYWDHYYPYLRPMLCYGVITPFGQEAPKPLTSEEQERRLLTYRHAHQHYMLEQIEYRFSISEDLLQTYVLSELQHDIFNIFKKIDEQIMYLIHENPVWIYCIDKDIEVILSNYSSIERTIAHGGMSFLFRCRWIIMNSSEKRLYNK